jgi:hypothetical protein
VKGKGDVNPGLFSEKRKIKHAFKQKKIKKEVELHNNELSETEYNSSDYDTSLSSEGEENSVSFDYKN